VLSISSWNFRKSGRTKKQKPSEKHKEILGEWKESAKGDGTKLQNCAWEN
jgi:hypothetical protein